MKKKLIIIGIVLALIVTLLCIPRSTYEKWFGKKVDPVPEDNQSCNLELFVLNSKDQVVGIKIPVSSIEEDVIRQKWEYYTTLSTHLPVGYSSPVCQSTKLDQYEIKDGVLTMHLSNDFLSSKGKETIDALAWTYCNDSINEVAIQVDSQKITELNNYSFQKINKKLGINAVEETSFLFEADWVTIIRYVNDECMPVTYYFESPNKIEYTLEKILEENIELQEYSFSAKQLSLEVNLDTPLTDNMKKEIQETLLFNYDLDKITVTKDTSVLFELDVTQKSSTDTLKP
jgi:hypothetical protein